MKPLTRIASFVQSSELASMPPDRFDRVKRHVLDAWVAQVAGSQTEAGIAAGRLLAPDDALSGIVVRCAQARCTEIDDVHLTSCTTPGSVVVSTGLALVRDRASGKTKVGDFCAAMLAGCESMIRLGAAIDGPVALHKGVWPTAYTAPFGSAAAAARLLALDVEQTENALATSLVCSPVRAVPSSPARSSRWLSLGIAAANGLVAVRGARVGLVATPAEDASLLRMTRGIGRQYLFDRIGMKPFPTARQALAAIEAAQQIVDQEQLAPSNIDRIIVGLPEPQRVIVDRPGFPRSRFDSIVNVRYQVALAIAARDRLLDVRRTPPFDSIDVRRLMARVAVTRARDLDAHYPRSWPARVDVRARGRRYRRIVLHPRGDATRPFDWSDLGAKAQSIAASAVGAATISRVIAEWRAALPDAPMPALP